MNLDCIVTLANRAVRLRFLAMERSLRAVGCNLPLRVIPYDEDRFELPANAEWWEIPEIIGWTKAQRTHPTMRKYQALTIPAFQFVDSDVVFLRDPVQTLAPLSGFVTSCGHWHNPAETLTGESKAFYAARSTTWQKEVFNTGQWACSDALYTPAELIARAEEPAMLATCVRHRYHEQPGVNLLVQASGVAIQNLTLPPWNMQSTWAGDYPGAYRPYWKTDAGTPYLIHWAGVAMEVPRPINELFLNYLMAAERREWEEQLAASVRRRDAGRRSWRSRARVLKRAAKAFAATWRQG